MPVVLLCVLAAGLLARSGGEVAPSKDKFLTRALGEKRSGAPLTRRPAPGVRIRVDRSGFRVTRRGATVGLATVGLDGGAWERYDGGFSRPTEFGRETVVVDPSGTEQFLTVEDRQGKRDWEWLLSTGDADPRLQSDGSILYVLPGGQRVLSTAPVAILDARGHDVTPDSLRWSLRKHDGSWRLGLQLDDSRLPVPYVIDPAIDYPTPLYLSSTASTMDYSWRLVGTSPSGANTATNTTPGQNSTGYILFVPGFAYTTITAPTSSPAGAGWIVDTAGGTGFPTGNWVFTVRTDIPDSTLVAGHAILNVGIWKGTISGGTFTSTGTILNPATSGDDPANQNLRTSVSPVTTNVTISVPRFSLASNERLLVEFRRKQVGGINSGTSSRRRLTFEVNSGTARIAHPAADDTAPENSLSITSASGAHYSSGTLYYKSDAAGSFAFSNALTDGGSGPYGTTYPAIGTTGWTHSNETVTTGPPYVSSTYSWTPNPSNPADQTLVGQDQALQTADEVVTFVSDTAAPTGMSASVTGGYYTSASIPVTLDDGSDTGSGVNTASGIVERDEAPLDNGDGTCDAFADSWSTVTLSGGNDTTVQSGKCYRYRYTISDNVGNQAVQVGTSLTAKVDTSAPSDPSLAFGSFSNAVLTGGVVYYLPSAASGQFQVTANGSSDAQSGVASHGFPAAASGWSVSGSGNSRTYSHSGSPTDPAEPNNVFATNGAGLNSNDVSFTVTPDGSGPSVTAPTVTSGFYSSTSVGVTVNGGTDGGSGVAAGSSVVQRDEAPLDNGDGTCDAFPGSWSTVTLSGGDDTTVQTGKCYRYREQLTDNLGNVGSSTPSNTAKIDISAPTDPSLAHGSFSNAALNGGVVWYRPGAASGQFEVTASSTDVQSGIASYTFPAAASGWTVSGSGASRTYGHSGSPSDPSEPNNVRATNGAGLESNDVSFTVSPDSTPPSVTAPSVTAGYYTSTSVAVGTNGGSDSDSGLASGSSVVQRDEAPLDNGDSSCDAFPGSWSGVTLSGGDDTTVQSGKCYRYRELLSDAVGNQGSSSPSATAKVDTSAPSDPSLAYGSFSNAALNGGVVWYRPGAASGQFEVTASSTDAQSGVAGYSFPAPASGWSVSGSGNARMYTHAGSPTNPAEPNDVSSTNGAGLGSNAVSFTVSPDTVAPSVTPPSVTADFYTAASVPVTLNGGTDADSGIDAGSSVVERDEAPLDNGDGSCDAFPGSWSAVTLSGGSDTSVESGKCYRYRELLSDKVGNQGSSSASATAKVDTSSPTDPILSFGSFSNASVTGSTIYFRPGVAGGFRVSTSSTDSESGVASFSFPVLGSGWSSSPSGADNDYSFTPAAGDPAEPNNLHVTNGAGLDSDDVSFTVTPDGTAPSVTAPTVAGGFYSSLSVPVALNGGSDADSGIAPGSSVVQRDEAPLDNGDGSCDAFPGSWSAVTLSGGSDTSVESGKCYRYRELLSDKVGNQGSSSASATAKVDTSAPGAPGLSYGSFTNAAATGDTVYFRPSASGGQFQVTASAGDAQSGIASYSFPAAASGWTVSGSGSSRTYSHSGSPSDPADPNDVTATNGAGVASAASSFTVTPDGSAPTGQSATLAGGPYYSTTSVAFTTGDGSDTGSGLDTSSRLVERSEAVLTNGTCGGFGAYSGSYTSPDTSVTSGNCYRYRFSIADRVGNRSAWVETAEAKVDASAPGAPTLTISESPADPDQQVVGQTLYYKPGTTGGAFTVAASASDPDSGLQHVSFPAIASVTGGGLNDSTAPFEEPYVWDALTTADAAAPVTATNNAGTTGAAANFQVRPDSAAPTTSIQCDGGGCSGWHSVDVSISLSATDAAAGVSQIRYTTDGSDPTPITGIVYSAPFTVGVTTQVRFRAYDNVGNEEAVGSQTVQVDTTQPQTTAGAANTSGSVFWNGSGTVFYRPGGSGSFDLTATVTDAESGPERATFPTIAGFGAGGDDLTSPFSSSYSYSGTPVEPSAQVVTGRNGAGLTSNDTVTIAADASGPTGQSATVTGGYYTALSVPVTLGNGSDTGSGVDPATGVVERSSATLSSGNCGSFGGWSSVALSGGADTSVLTNTCYRYRYKISDRVGNVSSPSAASADAKVDATAPGATMNNPGNPLQGEITLTGSGTDGGSGPNTATFQYKPTAGSWTTIGSDSTSPYAIDWDTLSVPDGRYDFRVIVTDHAGNSTTSAAVINRQITNNPPIVSITAPGDYVNAADPNPYTITATASAESPKTVDDVEFFRCSNTSVNCSTGSWASLGVDATAPYSASWALDPEGARALRAVVTDNTSSTNADILNLTIDRTLPSAQTISLNGGPWFTAASVSFATGDGSDGGSGLDLASRLVERAEAPLAGGSCDPFGAFGGSFTSPDASVASGNCYRYRFSIADSAGNRSSWVETVDAKVDTSAPTGPTLVVSETPADPDQYVAGTTVFYRPGGGRAGSFSVETTTSDPQSGIDRVTFPAIAGMTGGGDDLTGPYQGAYDWTETTGAFGAQTVTARNNAGATSPASFTVTPDSSAPTGQSAALVGGPYYTTLSVAFTTDDGADSGSGLDTSTRLVERAEAPLTDGNCGSFSAYSGSHSSPDTSVASGNCYRYRFSIADHVGNRSAWLETADAKVDTSVPGAPTLSFGSLSDASVTGSTVFYRPGAGSGQFTVTASSTDGESGIASYGFPTAASGWTVSGSGASRTYSHSGAPSDPAEPNDVTATNGAGLASTPSSFTVTPDASAPTGISASITGGYYTASSVAVTLDNGSDPGSGIDPASAVVERDEAPLDNGDGTCDAFPASWSTVALSSGNDTSVQSGKCYRYRYKLSDRVGNQATSAVSATAKVDTSAPALPTLSFGSLQAAAVTGSTVYFRPTAASGQFAATASSSDGQSGVASYSFPAAASGWTVSGSGDTRTYSHSGSPSDPAEPNDVTAVNGAGVSSAAAGYTVTPDASTPVSSILCDGAACAGWAMNPVSVTLSATDTGSGLTEIRYTTDGSDPTATTGTVYSGAFAVSVTTDVRYRGFDRVGNAEAVSSQTIVFDATGPTGPALTLAESPADPDQHVAGSTLYYRPGDGRSGTFTVHAATSDPESGIEKVVFPAVTGMTGGGDDFGSPYQASYDWVAATGSSGAQTITSRNNAAINSTAAFAVTPDTDAPSGQSADLAGGPFHTSLSVPLSLGSGSDDDSGIDAGSGLVEREVATLSNDNCVGWSGVWSSVTLSGGADTSVLTDRCYRYRYTISDNVGNQSGPSALSAVAKVDATDPVTSDDAPAGWSTVQVDVTLNVTETGSGLAWTQYRVDGGSFQNGTSVTVPAPADHSNDGMHTIEYRSFDNAGNLESLRSATVRIDTTLPTTSDDAPTLWRNTPVTVTLTPGDALSGVASTEYRVDGGSFQNGTSVSVPAPADHSNDGSHTIEYRSTDNAGNTEQLASATVKIDTTLPTGSVSAPTEGVHVNGVVPVTAAADDGALSGIASVEFLVRPNGAGGFTTISTDTTAPFEASWDSSSTAEGDAELKVVVLDNASNSLTSAIRNVVVDNPPAVSLDDPGANVAGLIELAATSSPDTTQVVFEWSPEGANIWTPIATDLTQPFAASFDTTGVADARYDFRAVATDGGGFGGSSLRASRVDNTVPSVSVSDPPSGATVGGPNVHLGASASDLGSGVAHVRFEARPAGSGAFADLGTDLSAPYDAWWNTTALSGVYELRAIATDGAGNPATSVTSLVVIDSTAPSVTLGDAGSLLRGVVTLSASTQGAAVTQVVFKRKPTGGDSWSDLETDTAGPWNAAFDTHSVADGLYDLRAQAQDSLGTVLATHTRENVRVDNTAPTLTSATPADGSSVASATSIVLVASETVAAVPGATLDGAVATPEIVGSQVTFATGTLGGGEHTLTGSLQDAAGNASPFRVRFSVRVAAPTTLAVRLGKPKSTTRGRTQTFSIPVTLSSPARVQVTLLSPRGRRLRTSTVRLPAGRRSVSLSVPRASLPPGRYTILVTATASDGTQVLKRTQVMIKKAKPARKKRPDALQQPAPQGAVTAVPTGGPGAPPPVAAPPASDDRGGPVPPPTTRTAEKPTLRPASKPLSTATKFVGEKNRRTLGLTIVILSVGAAIGFLIKIELHRLLARPRRVGGLGQ